MKRFRGYQPDGITFGMEIETGSAAYRAIRKHTAPKQIPTSWGGLRTVPVCPYQYVAGVMEGAGWLVAEGHYLRSFTIDDGPEIVIEYPEGVLPLRV